MYQQLIDEENWSIHLPIRSVDGVNVHCKLLKEDDHSDTIDFVLESAWDADDTLYIYKITNQDDFDKLMEQLPKLRFCKMKNMFFSSDDDDDLELTKLELAITKLVPTCDTIVWGYGECSVCLDNTTTRTKCGHHICLVCESGINTGKCPVCRQCYLCPCDN